MRGAEHRGSGTRDWGPPGFEERRNVESTTQRGGESSHGIKSRSGLYCTLSRAASRRVPSTIADVAGGQLCAINESLLIRLRASRAKGNKPAYVRANISIFDITQSCSTIGEERLRFRRLRVDLGHLAGTIQMYNRTPTKFSFR